MDKIKTFLQGFIIGLGKIMPGVSGSVMAVCFGIYERMIAAFSKVSVLKKDAKFIGTLGLGIILAIIFGANIIGALLINSYVPTMMFMIGMMIPGLFPILKEIKNTDITFGKIVICATFLFFLVYLSVLGTTGRTAGSETYLHEFISLFLCGIIDAASTIIPGISGSALLMLFGYYENIIASLANIFSLESLLILTPFLLGMTAGVVLTSKAVTYLFKKHRALTYMIIAVFASFSIVAVFFDLVAFLGNTWAIGKYLIFTALGFITTFLSERLFK